MPGKEPDKPQIMHAHGLPHYPDKRKDTLSCLRL
jgi:hypothetical protein